MGTYLANVSVVDDPVSDTRVGTVKELHNDLLPTLDQITEEEDRVEKLKQLLRKQDWNHLSQEQQKLIDEIILKRNSLFIVDQNELSKIEGPPAELVLKDPRPVRSPLYRYPEKAKQLIETIIQYMLEKGVIEPSTAAWLSPIVLVNKPDGSKRMCLDYRKVNEHLKTDIYPLPHLEELVDAAAGNKYYVTLDLKDAYYQVELAENSRDVTTFSEYVALYRFTRLPFGIAVSPSLFSRQLARVLTPLKTKGYVQSRTKVLRRFQPQRESETPEDRTNGAPNQEMAHLKCLSAVCVQNVRLSP